ncbi:MAG: binding-protein-dependent transport system inner rane component [Actinomycetia bacterium]|nr:binding-protein-dependent transport system inner rane component [Actinomycetes bacterium]
MLAGEVIVPAGPTSRLARTRSAAFQAGRAARRVVADGRLASFIALLVIWQLVTIVTHVPAVALPPPSAVVTSLWDVLLHGDLVGALGYTMQSFAVGFALSVLVGVPAGLGMGLVRRLRYVIDPYVTILLGTPFVAFIPVLLLWTGLGIETRIAAAFLFSLPFVIVNAEAGVRDVDESMVSMARSFEVSNLRIFREVILPGALGSTFVGLRLGASHGFKGVIIAELLISNIGLGGLVNVYGGAFRTDHLLAVVFTALVIVLLINAVFRLLSHYLLPWRAGQQQQN